MKQLFYLLTFLVSAGTVGVITTNPHFVRQGAALLSLVSENTMEIRGQAPNFEDAQLARFMADYPQQGDAARAGTPVQTMSPPMVASRSPYTSPSSSTPIPMGTSPLVGSGNQSFAPQAAYPQQYYSAQAQYQQAGISQSGGVKISTLPDSEIDSAGFARSGLASTNSSPQTNFPSSPPSNTPSNFAPPVSYQYGTDTPVAAPNNYFAVPAPAHSMSVASTVHANLPTVPPVHSATAPTPAPPIAQPAPPASVQTLGPVPVPQGPESLHSPDSPLHSPPSTLHSPPSTLHTSYSFSSPNVTSTGLHSEINPNVHLPEPQIQEMPIRSAIPDPARISSQFQINPSVMVEEIPCYGAEMVARVGTKVILMGDLLPQLKRAAHKILNENLKDLSEDKLKEVTQEEKDHFIETWVEMNYSGYLQEQIMGFLVYNDFCMTKSKEEREHFEKKMSDDFDQNDVPAMIKEMGLKDKVELKECLKSRFGTSIEQERSTTVRNRLAHQWLLFAVETAEGECTHDQMMDYYSQNIKQFESKARTQWKEMVVMFSNHKSEREAWDKIVWMGNQVAAGVPFDGVAQLNSEGFTASKGGFWNWTQRGSLASQKMEETLFSLPEGKLSPIIKTEKGLHIVQVTKREEEKVTPFIEAQVVVRERIKSQRRQKHHEAYFDDLRRKYPTIVVREKIDFNTRLLVRPI